MFCPKCGSQNADETKFCRGCGADLSNVLAVVDGKQRDELPLAEKHIDLFSSGLRGLMIGAGFLIVSGAAFVISMRYAVLGLFFLAFASYFLGTGISRLVQAKAIKSLRRPDVIRPDLALPPGQTEYIKPSQSIFETEDLVGRHLSVTEHTTSHLQMDSDDETITLPKK